MLPRPVPAVRLFDWPPRRGAPVPGTYAGIVRSRRADGRRHRRVRRDVHEGQGARVPPRAERSPHHHQHSGYAARQHVHQAFYAGDVRRRWPVTTPATAECRTSEITLAEFKTLKGKMDAFNPAARTPSSVSREAHPVSDRPLFGAVQRPLADPSGKHRAVQGTGREDDAGTESAVVPMPFNGLHAGGIRAEAHRRIQGGRSPGERRIAAVTFDRATSCTGSPTSLNSGSWLCIWMTPRRRCGPAELARALPPYKAGRHQHRRAADVRIAGGR